MPIQLLAVMIASMLLVMVPAAMRNEQKKTEASKARYADLATFQATTAAIDCGVFTTDGAEIALSGRSVKALCLIEELMAKEKDLFDHAFIIRELPHSFEISVTPWNPERGHVPGFGGLRYEVSKLNGTIVKQSRWR